MTYLFILSQFFIFLFAIFAIAKGATTGRSWWNRHKQLYEIEDRHESLRQSRRDLLVKLFGYHMIEYSF